MMNVIYSVTIIHACRQKSETCWIDPCIRHAGFTFLPLFCVSLIRARASASLISSSSVQRTYSDVLVFPLSLFFLFLFGRGSSIQLLWWGTQQGNKKEKEWRSFFSSIYPDWHLQLQAHHLRRIRKILDLSPLSGNWHLFFRLWDAAYYCGMKAVVIRL